MEETKPWARAIITSDLINGDSGSRNGDGFVIGIEWGDENPDGGTTHKFHLDDDDGETYYRGTLAGDDIGIDLMLDRLWQWGAYDAGTTAIFMDGQLEIG